MASELELEFDWRHCKEEPDRNRAVAFNKHYDTSPRQGKFRNGVFIEPGNEGRIWGPRAIARWVYLEANGTMKRKDDAK